jgi:hypothetical protein
MYRIADVLSRVLLPLRERLHRRSVTGLPARWGSRGLDVDLSELVYGRAAMSNPRGNVVLFALPAEMHQAEHFMALISQQWAALDEEIATQCAGVATFQQRGDLRGVERLRHLVAAKRREQFELDQLRAGLEQRFFARDCGRRQTKPVRRFDVAVARKGVWWNVSIPELDESTRLRRRGDVEIATRAFISAIIGAPIAEIGVRIVSESLFR